MILINLTLDQINAGLRAPGIALGASQFTYSVPGAGSVWPGYAAGEYPSNNYGVLSAAQAANFRAAIQAWDELIAPNFTEVADNAGSRGEVRIAFTRFSSASQYGTSYPSAPTTPGGRAGDFWLDPTKLGTSFAPTTTAFDGMLHEIGHVLGLKHPFETPTLPAIYANKFFSVMYDVTPSTTNSNHYQWALFSDGSASVVSTPMRASTPMVLDVAAVQAIYGADPTTRAGNDTYTFVQGSLTVQTIYDAGGTDTFDFSNFTRPNTIDLRPGAYSNVGEYSAAQQYLDVAAPYANSPNATDRANAQRFINYAQSTIASIGVPYEFKNNLAIAFGTTIENATGGSAADNITGNDVANYLRGGGGDDVLTGGGGADTLAGGTGNDQLFVDDASDVVVELSGEGFDTVVVSAAAGAASYTIVAGAEIELLQAAAGTSPINLTGNTLAQRIEGNVGNNVLNGGGGSDTLTGFAGDDTYLVRELGSVVVEANGGGSDTVFTTVSYNLGVNEVEVLSTVENGATTPIDLIGNFATQLVIGNYGDNVLNGGSGGQDILIGLRGNDVYAAGDQSIRIVENAGEGSDTLVVFGDYQIRNGVSIEVFGAQNRSFTTPLTLRGNEVAQTIIGNAGANVIDGRGGADTLVGDGGADVFAFTTALGGGNVDSIVDFASGTDKIGLASDVFAALDGSVAVGAFVLGTAAVDGDDRLIYDQASGRLFYDADANGAGAAVQFAQLAAGTALTAADFVLVPPVADLVG